MCYSTELLRVVEIVKGLPEGWGECLYTVPFDHNPQVLACWKELVAVGLDSGDIVIVDVITGIRTSVLSGHAHPVGSLAFRRMGHCSYPEATTKPSCCGISKPVCLRWSTLATPAVFVLSPFPRTTR